MITQCSICMDVMHERGSMLVCKTCRYVVHIGYHDGIVQQVKEVWEGEFA